jgi:hypothetical protein
MRQPVPFFLSYAHSDAGDVDRFRAAFEPLLKSAAPYEFGGWMDRRILPGEQWRTEIEEALRHSRFGLLLLSPDFLASAFITQNELPALLAKKMVVPVELQRLLFDGTLDLKGLGQRQVFRDSKGRAFDGCRSMPARRAFARELFTKLIALLKKYPC